jgi:hypothetical protein
VSANLTLDTDNLRSVLSEVSGALGDRDAIGIIVSIEPFIEFIAKNDPGLPAKVAVAVAQGSEVLGALFIKRRLDGVSGRHQMFQRYEHDESANKCVQAALDKLITTPDAGKTSELLNIQEIEAAFKASRESKTARADNRIQEAASALGDLSGIDPKRLGEELRERSTSFKNDKAALEAALDQPHHLFFYSAVDPNGVARFFDLMPRKDSVSISETAVGATKLGQCVETAYGAPGGGTHHVHRLYGKIRASTASQAMHEFAKATGLTQVTEIAETRTQREALPTWKSIFRNLGLQAK